MNDLLARLDRWLAANRPEYHRHLQPGAPEEELAAIEEEMGRPLPAELKTLWRWHNGQAPDFFDALQFNRSFMSVRRAREARHDLNELLEAGEFESPDWWHRGWIPFLDNGGGDLVCVDLDGAFAGREGQVILFWHDWESRSVEYPSLEAWLATFVASLEAGLWREMEGDFQPRDDAEWDEFTRGRNPGFPVEREA